MKCIIASPVACYPSAAGNAERVRQLHACLENLGYEVHFVLCPIQAMSTQLNEPAMKQIFGDRFHHLDNHPRPLQNALINFKRRYYHRIHKTGWLFDFMLSDGYVSRQSCQTFNQLVNDIEPDLILLVYGFMSPLLKHLNNRCKVLVDAQDKFSYRNRGIRQAGSEGYWLSLLPWQERYLLSQSDIVLAIQEQEGQYFKRLLATTPAEVVTLDILVAPDQPEATPSKNPVIGFLASGNQHNTEGLQRFIAQVWPSLLAQCPHAVLKVAGSVTKNITTDADNVELVGWVDDLKTFYQQCRLIINPCETGSGLKIKTIEAVGFGIPVVSTPCGAAGVEFLLPEENVQDLISPAFTHRCLTLLRDEDEAHQQANLCFQRLHQRVKHNRALLASLLQDSQRLFILKPNCVLWHLQLAQGTLNVMPFVSVIVPNYNHARFLTERIDSILQQDYQDYELILLDDKSTDNSAEVLASYATHPKVSHLIVNDVNSGSPFVQWQKGLELAQGEYIWLAESDDVAAPDFLSKLTHFADNEADVAIAFARSYRIDEHGNNQGFNAWGEVIQPARWTAPFVNAGNSEIARFLIHRNTIPNASAVLFKRSLGLKYISDIMNYRYCGDWLFWILLASHGNVAYSPETFNYFRRYDTATSLKRDSARLAARFAEYNAVVEAALARQMPGANAPLQHDWMIEEWMANKQHLTWLEYLTPNLRPAQRLRFYKALIKQIIKR